MNKQGNKQNPKGGIEWCHVFGPGTGYTWNVVTGCLHGCEWEVNGKIAECYAKTIADQSRFYPHGFAYHEFHPERLNEPLKLKQPAGIFCDSMSDLMGHWVPEAEINQVLSVMHKTPQHVYFLLTKNTARLQHFTFPDNCWLGASTPPDHMWGKPLSEKQKHRMLETTLDALWQRSSPRIAWLSAEPLSWDITPILEKYPGIIHWVVIGAASKGSRYYQPDPKHVKRLIGLCDDENIRIFMKGNLRPSLKVAFNFWRESYPEVIVTQQRLFT